MVILAPKGIGDDQPVVPGVDVPVQELVEVHVPVPQVLPRIDNEHADEELLHNYNDRSLNFWGGCAIISAQLQLLLKGLNII